MFAAATNEANFILFAYAYLSGIYEQLPLPPIAPNAANRRPIVCAAGHTERTQRLFG